MYKSLLKAHSKTKSSKRARRDRSLFSQLSIFQQLCYLVEKTGTLFRRVDVKESYSDLVSLARTGGKYSIFSGRKNHCYRWGIFGGLVCHIGGGIVLWVAKFFVSTYCEFSRSSSCSFSRHPACQADQITMKETHSL